MLLNIILTGLMLFGNVTPLLIPVSKMLTKNKPHRIEILDKDLVVWWNKHTKKWCALDDMCKHRQSSLSEGVLTKNGDVKCVYHGWEYGGCGTCKLTPSVDRDLKIKTRDYQVIEKYNMLWLTDNNENDIDVVSHLLKSNHIMTPWFVEDIKGCSHDLFVENALDFLHFNHTHNIPPYTRYGDQAIITEYTYQLQWYNETGFSMTMGPATFVFLAPYTVTFDILGVKTSIYSIPFGNDNVRFISNVYIPYENTMQKNILSILSYLSTPFFIGFGKKLFSEDITQLKKQYYYINKTGSKKYTNIPGDKPIFFYNKWIRDYKNITNIV